MIQTISTNQIVRPLDNRKDLLQVADLIETCFGPHLDPDGYLYLSQIRRAASNPRLVRWTYAAGELVSYPLNGYVLEEDGKVVGNLSLIPFYWKRVWRYLIANVAVHPDYRRQGIAKRLTEKALEHVKKRPVDSVWLHVREDNDAAVQLYRQFNFKPRDTRDTWVSHDPYKPPDRKPDGLSLVPCHKKEWRIMQKWLGDTYPPEVAWHLPLDLSRYKPGFLNAMRLLFAGKENQQWCAGCQGALAGIAVLEQGYSYADQVYISARPGSENSVIPFLLPYIKENYSPGRALIVNFPAHEARLAFERSGFKLLNTLIWMEIRIN